MSAIPAAVIAVVIVALAGLWVAGAATAPDHPQAVPAGLSATPTDPNVASCEVVVCNSSAAAQRQQEFPPARPIPSDASWITQSQALAIARQTAEGLPNGSIGPLTDIQRSGLLATAGQTTLSAFEQAAGLAHDPGISPDRPVWVVTVHGAVENDNLPGRPSVIVNVYTDVIDAPTGDMILVANGVDTLG